MTEHPVSHSRLVLCISTVCVTAIAHCGIYAGLRIREFSGLSIEDALGELGRGFLWGLVGVAVGLVFFAVVGKSALTTWNAIVFAFAWAVLSFVGMALYWASLMTTHN